jgi:hypothetical protein
MIASSWKEAMTMGIPTYYGKPCRKCAGTVRRRASNRCVICDRARVHATEGYRKAHIRHTKKRRKTTEKGIAAKRRMAREQKQRIRSTPEGRLTKALRDRLRRAVEGNYRGGSAVAALGCSILEFKEYIENLFEDGWRWDKASWGPVWHLDHIIPLSWFDLSNPADIAKACHFSNIRPYLALLNCKEGDRRGNK